MYIYNVQIINNYSLFNQECHVFACFLQDGIHLLANKPNEQFVLTGNYK